MYSIEELKTRYEAETYQVIGAAMEVHRQLEHYYQADYLCFDHIVVELKAVSELAKSHDSQVLNYLNATGYEVGLLLNFGEASLKYHRLFNARSNNLYNP